MRCLTIQDLSINGVVKFHPSFSATRRSYVYLLDWKSRSRENVDRLVSDLDRLLQPLVGTNLDYYGLSHGALHKQHYNCTLALATAFPVFLPNHEAREASAIPVSSGIGIALTSDRFLRRMVRILVATALDCCWNVTEAVPRPAGVESESSVDSTPQCSLLRIVQSRDRREASKAAPAAGLVFVGVEFD
jgi:tRNA U38,U39,U40 pseudouridine synthase TruA